VVATALALLPVLFVVIMATRKLRPWWRRLKQILALPKPPSEASLPMTTATSLAPAHPKPAEKEVLEDD